MSFLEFWHPYFIKKQMLSPPNNWWLIFPHPRVRGQACGLLFASLQMHTRGFADCPPTESWPVLWKIQPRINHSPLVRVVAQEFLDWVWRCKFFEMSFNTQIQAWLPSVKPFFCLFDGLFVFNLIFRLKMKKGAPRHHICKILCSEEALCAICFSPRQKHAR